MICKSGRYFGNQCVNTPKCRGRCKLLAMADLGESPTDPEATPKAPTAMPVVGERLRFEQLVRRMPNKPSDASFRRDPHCKDAYESLWVQLVWLGFQLAMAEQLGNSATEATCPTHASDSHQAVNPDPQTEGGE